MFIVVDDGPMRMCVGYNAYKQNDLEIRVHVSATIAIWTTKLAKKLIKLCPVLGFLCKATMLARQDVLYYVSQSL